MTRTADHKVCGMTRQLTACRATALHLLVALPGERLRSRRISLLAETIKNPIAVFAALDKVTGRISHLEIPINQTVAVRRAEGDAAGVRHDDRRPRRRIPPPSSRSTRSSSPARSSASSPAGCSPKAPAFTPSSTRSSTSGSRAARRLRARRPRAATRSPGAAQAAPAAGRRQPRRAPPPPACAGRGGRGRLLPWPDQAAGQRGLQATLKLLHGSPRSRRTGRDVR